MSDTIKENSEILFIYDAKSCNPNGDIDNENKPRMDWDTNTNLVSDVRLKRYIRDYFDNKGFGLFVTEKADKAETRVKQILGRKPNKNKPVGSKDLKKISDTCKDVVYFGAVLATEHGNDHLVGPVQFNWGYSLNQVELQESKTITSSFSSGEGIGKDYRVKYSLIAFQGAINAKTAKKTNLSQKDIKELDSAMIKSIPLNRTRSKIGQTPRLYIRVVLNDSEHTLNDLREYITINKEEGLTGIKDFKLDLTKLDEYLKSKKDKIKQIMYWKDENINISNWMSKDLPLKEIKSDC